MSISIPQSIPPDNDIPSKQCLRCLIWLSSNKFSPNNKNKDGLQSWCKKCRAKYAKETMTPNRIRDRDFRYKYGITLNQYYQMFRDQKGLCAICHNPETRIDLKTGQSILLRVDHDHKTGDVRSLLCNKCNIALGIMGEDSVRINALADYAKWCQTRQPLAKFVQSELFDILDLTK